MDIKAMKPVSSVAASPKDGGRQGFAADPATKQPPIPEPPERLDPATLQNQRAIAEAVAARVRQFLREIGRDLEFQVDIGSGDAVITVRDTMGNVVRKIPGEEALQMMRRLSVESGTFIDSIV
jgi:uncharacterized FlaG/YvyC family protein